MPAPSVRLLDLRCHVVRTETRFPFRYGIASMTAVPHLFLRGEFEIAGRRSVGFSAEGLPPKWFTKDPAAPFSEDLAGMLESIERAVTHALAAGAGENCYDWWRSLLAAQRAWAEASSVPPLLAQLGTSLVERAAIDALCRASGEPFAKLARENAFGLRPGEIHPELAGLDPGDAVRAGLGGGWGGRSDRSDRVDPSSEGGSARHPTLFLRHTVGLADPILDEEIPPGERVRDGLPQSLEACLATQGLRYFKIKLCGALETDAQRLRRIAGLFRRDCPEARYTLDGNEQYASFAEFRAHWESHRADPALRELLSPPGLLFVEQPLHRDEALADHVAADLADWPGAPPLIVDESDAGPDSARRALVLGYAGTSHKNCKGVFKSLANAALFAHRSASAEHAGAGRRPCVLSGEDLVNTGPVALLQDLAVLAALGVPHAERNGHHYFRDLGAFGAGTGERLLRDHGDLFRALDDGAAALSVKNGRLPLASVAAAPFGTAFRIDEALDPWLPLEEWRASGAFEGY